MWAFIPSFQCSIDDHLAEFTEHVKFHARDVFGAPVQMPLKPWITPRTWAFLKPVARLRRVQCSVCELKRNVKCRYVFLSWAATLRQVFSPSRQEQVHLGWAACSMTSGAYDTLVFANRAFAVLSRCVAQLHYASSLHVVDDRRRYFEQLSMSAQLAAHNGDIRGTFSVVRKLSGFRIRPPKVIKLKDGTISTTEEERQNRWQEHFCDVFAGELVSDHQAMRTEPQYLSDAGSFDASPNRIEKSIACMKSGKGLGPDGIPCELLKAGGFGMALQLSRLSVRVVDDETWPTAWKGGRLVDLFKGKGCRIE